MDYKMSDMYNNESSLLGKISKKKDYLKSLKKEIRDMEKDYQNQNQLRKELTAKFEDLQESNSSDWEKFRREYELDLDFAEGDKFSFIETAEAFMDELNEKISAMEAKVKKSSADAKKKSQQMLDELKYNSYYLICSGSRSIIYHHFVLHITDGIQPVH